MKFRTCAPVLVPGTAAHGNQVVPSNFVNRIELARSLLTTNSQTFVPSDAPNRPELTAVPAVAGFIDWFAPNPGGAAVRLVQVFVPATYERPSTVPVALRRNAKICVVEIGTSAQSF